MAENKKEVIQDTRMGAEEPEPAKVLKTDFDKVVNDYQKLVAEHNKTLEEYQKVVKAFNKLLKEFNDLHIATLLRDDPQEK